MPRLPADLAESADEAAQSSGDFQPLEFGVYTARLSKCDAGRTRDGKKAMWKLEFDQIFDLDGEKCSGRLWSNITLEESVNWKIAQFFGAFGVPTTTDTDDLINTRIRLEVSKRPQTVGKNAGKEVNDIDRFSSLAPSDFGYDKGQQLITRLTKQAPAKAAPKKASAPAAKVADPEVEEAADALSEFAQTDDDLEF